VRPGRPARLRETPHEAVGDLVRKHQLPHGIPNDVQPQIKLPSNVLGHSVYQMGAQRNRTYLATAGAPHMLNRVAHTGREVAPPPIPQRVSDTAADKLGLLTAFAAPPLHDPHVAHNAPRVDPSGLQDLRRRRGRAEPAEAGEPVVRRHPTTWGNLRRWAARHTVAGTQPYELSHVRPRSEGL